MNQVIRTLKLLFLPVLRKLFFFISPFILLVSVVIPPSALFAQSKDGFFDVDARGVYGGPLRVLTRIGPAIADLRGGQAGIFLGNSFKIGFASTTLAGLLSDNENDDILEGLARAADNLGNRIPQTLPPSDFTYNTLAVQLEYVREDASFITFSAYTDIGEGLLAVRSQSATSVRTDTNLYDIDSYTIPYIEVGLRLVLKITNNVRVNFGYGHRKDINADNDNRPEGFENLDGTTFTNTAYIVKF